MSFKLFYIRDDFTITNQEKTKPNLCLTSVNQTTEILSNWRQFMMCMEYKKGSAEIG